MVYHTSNRGERKDGGGGREIGRIKRQRKGMLIK
jgi:hypothetical protein